MHGRGRRRDEPRFRGDPTRHAPCFDGMVPDTGERRLMRAVLEDAIRTLLLARTTLVPLKRLRHDVAWIESTARDEAFTFESICDALGIDPGYLRGRLLTGGFARAIPPGRRLLRRSVLSRTRSCSGSY